MPSASFAITIGYGAILSPAAPSRSPSPTNYCFDPRAWRDGRERLNAAPTERNPGLKSITGENATTAASGPDRANGILTLITDTGRGAVSRRHCARDPDQGRLA